MNFKPLGERVLVERTLSPSGLKFIFIPYLINFLL